MGYGRGRLLLSQLPYLQSQTQDLNLLQTKWRALLNPVLANPILNGVQLHGQSLIIGSTTISHGLQRMPQGWIVTDISAAATIYRSAAYTPQSLILSASSPCVVSLLVY